MALTNTIEIPDFMHDEDHTERELYIHPDDPNLPHYFHRYGIIHTGEINCARVIFNAILKYDEDHKSNYTISGKWTDYKNLIYSAKWDGKINKNELSPPYDKDHYFNQNFNMGFPRGYEVFHKNGWFETDVCMDHPDFNPEPVKDYSFITSKDLLGQEDIDNRIMAKYLYTNYNFECYANFLGQLSHYDEFTSMKKKTDIKLKNPLNFNVVFQPEQSSSQGGYFEPIEPIDEQY